MAKKKQTSSSSVEKLDKTEQGIADTPTQNDRTPLMQEDGQVYVRIDEITPQKAGLTMKDVVKLPIVRMAEDEDPLMEIVSDDSDESEIWEDSGAETDADLRKEATDKFKSAIVSTFVPEGHSSPKARYSRAHSQSLYGDSQEENQHENRRYSATIPHDAASVFRDRGENAMGDSFFHETPRNVLPRLQGWMHKLSPKWFRGWQPRYFILEDKVLSWFKKESDVTAGRLSGAIDLNCVRIAVEICDQVSSGWACCGRRSQPGCTNWSLFDTTSEFKICPVGTNKSFHLRCKGEDAANWISALQKHQAAVLVVPSVDIIKNSKHFWRIRRLPPTMLENIADSGDIILFKSKGGVARLQRTFTRGQYDHVALLLKFGNGNIGVLESTGGLGVTVINWRVFLVRKWYELYPIIAVRRLQNVQRNQDRMQKLEKWVRETIGKPYELTLSTLRGKEAQHGYMCSQLVFANYFEFQFSNEIHD